jgi:hypothetical protein
MFCCVQIAPLGMTDVAGNSNQLTKNDRDKGAPEQGRWWGLLAACWYIFLPRLQECTCLTAGCTPRGNKLLVAYSMVLVLYLASGREAVEVLVRGVFVYYTHTG